MTPGRGIRRKGRRWEVMVRVGGVLYTHTFALDTPVREMRAWQRDQRARAPVGPPGTLTEDVARYLRTVRAMRTYRERERILRLWLEAFARRRIHRRGKVTPTILNDILAGWLADGLSPQTVKHRRAALRHLWYRLDGRDHCNPVVAAMSPQPAEVPTIVYPPEVIARVLAGMAPSASRARLRVLATTGLPHALLMALRPEDVDLETAAMRVRPRRKGQGSPPVVLPLLPEAVAAFRELAREDAWGAFSTSSLRKAWHRACLAAGVRPCRPYDLRHAFATAVYRTTGDLRTVASLLTHTSTRTTERYTRAAVDELQRAALARLSGAWTVRRKEPTEDAAAWAELDGQLEIDVGPSKIVH